VARLLGGGESGARKWKARPVAIVDAGSRKQFDLRIEVPVDDLSKLGELEELPSGPAGGAGKRRSIWPSIHPRLVELIRAHRSTMIFVNSRRLAERLAAAINELAGSEIALAHHGSVARDKRQAIEDRLKRGELPAIVATSSLELGIDMGDVDLVVQIEAPPSIASGLQRIGRAGHRVGGVPRGVIFPKHRGDLLGSAAAAVGMAAGDVEETFYPRNPLDVLAQQIVAACGERPWKVDELYALVRRAAPFAELPRSSFDGVLDMLSGRYPSDEFAELRPRISWDRVAGTVRAREGAVRVAVVNGGTIPDRGLYGVFLAGESEGKTSRRVGELDEEMVFETREGEVFVLGASSRSRTTRCWSARRRASPARCRSGVATGRVGRSSWASRSGGLRASCLAPSRPMPSGRCASATGSTSGRRATSSSTCASRSRSPARCRATAR
jgi:ATP-dependent Lhr-like helicase